MENKGFSRNLIFLSDFLGILGKLKKKKKINKKRILGPLESLQISDSFLIFPRK